MVLSDGDGATDARICSIFGRNWSSRLVTDSEKSGSGRALVCMLRFYQNGWQGRKPVWQARYKWSLAGNDLARQASLIACAICYMPICLAHVPARAPPHFSSTAKAIFSIAGLPFCLTGKILLLWMAISSLLTRVILSFA
jgi:hypothetical protein